ncbi:hypothetical protein GXM_01645 [Nostoc sphaeroides CCNUC1]|uniref:Uncharacterized protein n=1 Tax=Nostoc sphaeroides CCNUC1 TaxID=2653204 RepID=A0A5P8VUS3_9NOSO|nr:hypothetical protein GXM_01645 [Nostoc sphaeroides CCNUC1]
MPLSRFYTTNIDNYHQYQNLNEIWYLITFEDLPSPLIHYL